MSVHYVGEEELQACAIPQLEARSDGGSLYVRHPAENLWDVHRARGLLTFWVWILLRDKTK